MVALASGFNVKGFHKPQAGYVLSSYTVYVPTSLYQITVLYFSCLYFTPFFPRLTLFSGPFEDAQLPSKRIIGPKNYEFLESKREEFEKYLQVLEV